MSPLVLAQGVLPLRSPRGPRGRAGRERTTGCRIGNLLKDVDGDNPTTSAHNGSSQEGAVPKTSAPHRREYACLTTWWLTDAVWRGCSRAPVRLEVMAHEFASALESSARLRANVRCENRRQRRTWRWPSWRLRSAPRSVSHQPWTRYTGIVYRDAVIRSFADETTRDLFGNVNSKVRAAHPEHRVEGRPAEAETARPGHEARRPEDSAGQRPARLEGRPGRPPRHQGE